MLEKIRPILIRTSHPRNIGASARSLKTMGLSHLYLVSPKQFPSEEADWLASNAIDILEKATVVQSLSEALIGCQLVFGTSSRKRFIEWPCLTPREAAQKIKNAFSAEESSTTPTIAILFGNEQHGLTNLELETCHYQICIPTSPEYASLNLAQSVQIIAYELFLALTEQHPKVQHSYPSQAPETPEEPLATMEELFSFYAALEQTLVDIHFLKPKSLYLMSRLKRLFARATLSCNELNLLRGILTAIQKRV